MIRVYLHHDPDEQDVRVRAFRLARLELAEHLDLTVGHPTDLPPD